MDGWPLSLLVGAKSTLFSFFLAPSASSGPLFLLHFLCFYFPPFVWARSSGPKSTRQVLSVLASSHSDAARSTLCLRL